MVIRRTTDWRFSTARTLATVVLAVGLLWGCGPAVQFDRTPAPGTYVVRNGDTLYNIAWRYGLDHRDLSRWNGIRNPNRIYPGQRLRLSGKAAATPRRTSTSRSAPKTKPAPAPRPRQPAPVWKWPADGGLVSKFGDPNGLGQGVSIGGKEGQRIRAAGSGRVVYLGSGLIGYGQLLIIKHNDAYLSAYGYNKTVSVKEGDEVKAGQVIARMGRGPGNRPMLHFEIRRNGGPIDPLTQLPRR